MSQQLILSSSDGPGTTVLTLNRPDKRNALNIELMNQLCKAVEKAGRDKAKRVLVLRGSGPAFCAGLDLEEASKKGKVDAAARMVAKTLLALHGTSLVTIAIVHGAAMAGGAGLMSVCDYVIAEEDAKIGYPETRRGLVAALVMTFLCRQVGERDVRELLLTGEPISAKRALAIRLINKIVPTGNPMAAIVEMRRVAESVAKCGPSATAQTKKILDELWPTSVKQDIQKALQHHLKARHSKEADEGIKAFLQGRSPNWVP
jgi:methylglutaconyl-CoA hydratase